MTKEKENFLKTLANPLVDLLANEAPATEIKGAMEKLVAQLATKTRASDSIVPLTITLENELNRCIVDAQSFLGFCCGLQTEWQKLTTLLGKPEADGALDRVREFLGSLKVGGRRLQKLRDRLNSVQTTARRILKAAMADERSSECQSIPAVLVACKLLKLINSASQLPKRLENAWQSLEVEATAATEDSFSAYNRLGWIDCQREKFDRHSAALEERLNALQEADLKNLVVASEAPDGECPSAEKLEKRLGQLKEMSDGASRIRCRK